ncbi:hypothetical protein [Methyloglobulus sp.]
MKAKKMEINEIIVNTSVIGTVGYNHAKKVTPRVPITTERPKTLLATGNI